MSDQQKPSSATHDKEDFKQRKKALEEELNAIENKLGSSVETFRSDIQGRLSQLRPAYWVRKFPVYSLSLAVFAGYLLAPSSKSKTSKSKAGETEPVPPVRDSSHTQPAASRSADTSFTSIVANEVKRMLTRKVTSLVVDKLEDIVDAQLSAKESKEKQAR